MSGDLKIGRWQKFLVDGELCTWYINYPASKPDEIETDKGKYLENCIMLKLVVTSGGNGA
ncbi:hypothetical protein Cst_c08230 [Thermoclostridium stercorarium subsp. stercorarium DSM 8532]|uniref:Uncharacterized protein n=1 Tax=Thermoclostridium stercorarium (strain ATCC 35414 / DSM 8532 / NCIMB 11754) TaxID=1121335 RepID=L7VMF1_THES1|nr:hypothetical protein [Thermoclostridium stercorarium]AGC67824.1 hypothetical protein Cst_c08230 [Thermoclostridium stercorarium subsp. stercorarium DSM 8532]